MLLEKKILQDSSQSKPINTGQDDDIHTSFPLLNEKEKNVNIWYYLFIQCVVQEITFFGLFWLDFMPSFGTTNNARTTWDDVKQDFRWLVGLDGSGATCTVRAITFIGCYIINYVGSSLMLRYTEGATWTAVVAALVTPLGAIFWILFELNNSTGYFGFHPFWSNSSLYIIFGLITMSPFIYLYDREAQFLANNENSNFVFDRNDKKKKSDLLLKVAPDDMQYHVSDHTDENPAVM